MFGRYKPPKMSDDERNERKKELRDANVTNKELWAMIRSALLVIMPVVIGIFALLWFLAWLFLGGAS